MWPVREAGAPPPQAGSAQQDRRRSAQPASSAETRQTLLGHWQVSQMSVLLPQNRTSTPIRTVT